MAMDSRKDGHLSRPEIGYLLLPGSYCTDKHCRCSSEDGTGADETKRPAQTLCGDSRTSGAVLNSKRKIS